MAKIMYSRSELVALNGGRSSRASLTSVPEELRRRTRGKRAGTLVRAKRNANRRRFKPAIPSVIMGNVNSLPNKSDELSALVRNDRSFREISLICLSETWLNKDISDDIIGLPGFTVVRADRDTERSGKTKGGGLALFINNRWCNPGHVTVKETVCSRDIELLAVGLRPYYLPRELPHVIAVCVYIPPSADAATACDVIHSTIAGLQTQHPDAFYLISGDFNHATLESTLTNFYQFVDCPTRKNRTIDLLYANIKEAYKASPLPPLGKSDHNMVYLQPQYTPVVQRQPASTRSFRKWSPEAEEMLKDCMATTAWEVMQESYGEDAEGLEELTFCTTSYWNWCRDNVVPIRTVRCFANNKPWITCDVKALLNRKKRAFRNKDQEELRRVQGELKLCLREAKEAYSRKLERQLQQNNMRGVWEGMKNIMGCKKKGSPVEGSIERANDFNVFFNRFSVPVSAPASGGPAYVPPAPPSAAPPLDPLPPLTPTLSPVNPITAAEVRGELRRLRPRAAAGPDMVCPRLLKVCADELGEPLQHIFNLSLRLGKVPTQWKTSCIVPVPKKKGHSSALNDYRPVALTSHAMKSLERLILRRLKPQALHAQDPLQFGYQEKVGVEDAVLYLLHRVYSYMDKGGGAVRVMFFDFSSAFNTIIPPILKDKLDSMAVDPVLVAWISDFLTDRPQYVRTGGCTSGTVTSSTGAPQGTCLAPYLFTLYTSDFRHNSETCHMQKFSDDTAIVAFIRDGLDGEYRELVNNFAAWSRSNHLLLNTSKTKEMVLDFRRSRPPVQPVSIEGADVEVVSSYKYLGVLLDDKLDWSANTDALYRKGQTRLYQLRRLKSFEICGTLLRMVYQSVVASVLFYAVVCWGGNTKKRDTNRLDKLVKRASSVIGEQMEDIVTVQERRSLDRLLSIMDNVRHPLHPTLVGQRSLFSGRLRSQSCSTDRLRRSFVPRAISLFNSAQGGRRTVNARSSSLGP